VVFNVVPTRPGKSWNLALVMESDGQLRKINFRSWNVLVYLLGTCLRLHASRLFVTCDIVHC